MRADQALYENFHPAAAGFAAPKARRNYPGIIEHQQVVGLQEIEEFTKAVVTDPATGPVQP